MLKLNNRFVYLTLFLLGTTCMFFATVFLSHGDAAGASTHQANACPASLPLGELFTCSLTTTTEVDIYTFSASQNDSYYFRVSRESGAFSPRVSIVDADGDIVPNCSTYNWG